MSYIQQDLEKMRKVMLLPHNTSWQQLFSSESIIIKAILKDKCPHIHHIGSTAIPNISAKPIIDMLVVVDNLLDIEFYNNLFEADGYICMGEYGITGRRYYSKSSHHQHSYHIHLFAQDDPQIKRHLSFKRYLLDHVDVAQAYSHIKCCLADQFPDDIKTYVEGKTSFILMIDYKSYNAQPDQLTARDNVVIESHNPTWEKLARAEIEAIKSTTNLAYVAIEHLGSTSIHNLKAKPIIDIYIALESIETAGEWVKPLEAMGYCFWADNPNKLHHRYFKGMPPFGLRRTHQVHIMQAGQKFDHRVAFREALRNDRKLAHHYEQLKCLLAKECSDDRELYTRKKSHFIKNVLAC